MMLKDRMEKIRIRKSDNRGMALVTVIVAIGFIAALVSILLTTSLVNFKMKNVNERGKDTFYSAEQVLDEINVGLQRIVSDSMSAAYLEIMNNYPSYDARTKNEMLTTMYYENLWEALEVPGSHHAYYDVAAMENMFLKDTTKWHANPTSDGGGYGAIVVAIDDSGAETKQGNMITYLKDGVVLKNLKVYYKDEMGFVSVIQTDIRLSYPDFDFAATSELPNVIYYSFITDSGATIATTGTVDISGNIYTNNLKFTGPTSTGAKTTVTTSGNNVMTVKYNFDLKNTKMTTESGTVVWAKNLILDSSEAQVDGVVQLANDLNLKGKSSKVKLIGELVGFGYGANSNKSSAILVNGKESDLDFSQLKKITIAGRSYIGAHKAKVTSVVSPTDATENNDLQMGESLAVKSNQIFYLVPAGAVGVDEMTGRSVYGKNPLTKAEYENLKTLIANNASDVNHNYVEISDKVEVSSLGTTLKDYVAYNGAFPKAEKVFVPVSDTGVGYLVYFYMAFGDAEKANNYFGAYYAKNHDSIDRYVDFYLDEIKIPDTSNLVKFRTVGNMMVNNRTTSSGYTLVNANSNTTTEGTGSLRSDMDQYSKKFDSMCTKLISNYTYAPGTSCPAGDTVELDDKDYQIVYENIVDITTPNMGIDYWISNAVDGNTGIGNVTTHTVATAATPLRPNMNKRGWVEVEDIAGGKKAIICNDPTHTISVGASDDVNLIISDGDVVVHGDFNGLILCNGTLDVDGADSQLHASPSLVRDCLKYSYVDAGTGQTNSIALVLRDGNEYIYSSLDNMGETANLALGGLISYENWKKE